MGDVVFLHDLLPGEVDERLAAGRDIAIFPVGSVEQHGPHLLLGCDTYVAVGGSVELARACGGTVFPEPPYSWIGGLRAFSGTMNVRSRTTIAYLRDAVLSADRAGFRRIVVVNCHGGNFYTMQCFARDLWKDHGIPIICFYGVPGGGSVSSPRPSNEASGMCGGLAILGCDALVEKVRAANAAFLPRYRDIDRGGTPSSLQGARRIGVAGHDYFREHQHAAPEELFAPENAIHNMAEAAKSVAAVLEETKEFLRRRKE